MFQLIDFIELLIPLLGLVPQTEYALLPVFLQINNPD